MKSQIAGLLSSVLVDLGIHDILPEVSISDHLDHGDYSTNVAMKAAKILKNPPAGGAMEVALQVKEAISCQLSAVSRKGSHHNIDQKHQNDSGVSPALDILQDIERVEVAAPGFINFFITQARLISNLKRVLNLGRSYGTVSLTGSQQSAISFQPKRIVVEFTDPNPFKEFHIGHLYSNAVGESLSRLFQYAGNTVRRVNYQGDVGLHVAKSVWGMKKLMTNPTNPTNLTNLEEKTLDKRVKFLGQAYALGARAYEEDKTAVGEIKKLNFLIFISAQNYLKQTQNWTPQVNYQNLVEVDEAELAETAELYQKGREWSLAYFEEIYKTLGTKFDAYYFESIVGEYGIKIVRDHIADGIFEKSEGAIVFRGEKYGLHTRVFINALGLPTYEAKELGLAPTKYQDWPYDLSYIVTAKEISEYFKVLLAALGQTYPELSAKTHHIGHGMVRLPEGKMSSRTGKILTGEWLLSEARQKIYDYLQKSNSKYTKEDRDHIAQLAAVAAVKYSLLRVGIPADIAFDLDKSVSFEGDSGPYLLYTYARCMSVAEKARGLGINPEKDLSGQAISLEEREVMRLLLYFPQVVSEATAHCAPSELCTYLSNLAQAFNLFYAKHSILGIASSSDSRTELDQPNINYLRLTLTLASAQVLKTGLWLLGIEVLERM